MLLFLEEDIERAVIIKHHAEMIYRKLLGEEVQKATGAVRIRADDLIDNLFWLYKALYSQKFNDVKGESNDN